MLKLLKLLLPVLSRASHALVLTVMVVLFASQAKAAGVISNLFNFDLHNTAAGVVQGKGATYQGYVYGTTTDVTRTSGGTIFRVSISGGPPEVIYQFTTSDGYSPRATLLMSDDGYLYGTTHNSSPVSNKLRSGGGTVFRIKPDGSDFQTIYDFGGATNDPNVDDSVFADFALVEDATKLYGVAKIGGTNHTGQVFSIGKTTFQYLLLHDFPAGTLNASGGYQPTSEEGLLPSASLYLSKNDGLLYGVTASGGAGVVTSAGSVKSGAGTIFRLTTNGSYLPSQSVPFQTLFQFPNLDTTVTSRITNALGAAPSGPLLEYAAGLFVGTATTGGTPLVDATASGFGTVFKLDINDPTHPMVLYAFDNTNGARPMGHLVYSTAGGTGKVYGVTTAGSGTASPATTYGTLFALDPTVAYSQSSGPPAVTIFLAAQGITVNDGVSLGVEGDLYAATAQGGACTSYTASGYGAVLRYSLTTQQKYSEYSNCTNISRSGGGAFQMPWLWLLAVLGLVPPMRRWFAVRRG